MKRSNKIGCGVTVGLIALLAAGLILRELVTERFNRVQRFRPVKDVVVDVLQGNFADPAFKFRWRIRHQGKEMFQPQTFFWTHDLPTQRFDVVVFNNGQIVALVGAQNRMTIHAICDLESGSVWSGPDFGPGDRERGETLLARINDGRQDLYTLYSLYEPLRTEEKIEPGHAGDVSIVLTTGCAVRTTSPTVGATQTPPDMQDIVPAPIAAALPDNVKRVQPGMSLDRALDTLGLLQCHCHLSGHGYENNYGVDLMYSLPSDRWARVSFRLDRTRTITDPVPQRPSRGAVWDSLGNCPVKSCRLTITPKEEPNTTSDRIRQPADGSPKPSR